MIDVKEILMGMYPYVQYISFGLLMLSGLSLPISEDIVFILSASIAATVAFENRYYIFAGCFLGAYMSDITAYFIGKYGIKKVLFSPVMVRLKLIDPEKLQSRLDKASQYIISYGGKTLFFGRFIPFGMRNVIFMTCGLTRMNLLKFLIIDLCAVTCTSCILFSLGYYFGNNYEVIIPYLNRYKLIIAALVITVAAVLIIRNAIKKRHNSNINGIAIAVVSSKNQVDK